MTKKQQKQQKQKKTNANKIKLNDRIDHSMN